MTTAPTQQPAARRRPAASTSARILLTGAAVLVGAGAFSHGIDRARAIARETGAWLVAIPVRTTDAMPPSALESSTPHGIPLLEADGARHTLWLETPDSTTALLAGSDQWVPWLTIALVAVLAAPLLRRAVHGRLFERASVQILAAATAVVAVGWLADGLLPLIAAQHALGSGQTALAAEWLSPDLRLPWWPLGYLAALVVIALVVRAGTPRLPVPPWEQPSGL